MLLTKCCMDLFPAQVTARPLTPEHCAIVSVIITHRSLTLPHVSFLPLENLEICPRQFYFLLNKENLHSVSHLLLWLCVFICSGPDGSNLTLAPHVMRHLGSGARWKGHLLCGLLSSFDIQRNFLDYCWGGEKNKSCWCLFGITVSEYLLHHKLCGISRCASKHYWVLNIFMTYYNITTEVEVVIPIAPCFLPFSNDILLICD